MGYFASPRRSAGGVKNEVLVSGVETITDIGGGMIEIVFYINRPGPDGLAHVILPDALVMPIAAVPDAIGKALMAIGRKVLAAEDRLTVVH